MALHQLELKPLFTYRSEVQPYGMANSSGGQDLLLRIVSGSFEGERLSGELVADYCSDNGVYRPSGAIKSEVHLLLRTNDGADIHMHYMANTVPQADGSFRAFNFPFFETAAEPYYWLNNIQALTQYEFEKDGSVACHVFEL
jgi:hypothetical protein